MVSQEAVLKLPARRAERGRSISSEDLAREFSLSLQAGSGRLARLWRNQLVEAQGDRRSRFRFRLEPGERLRDLRFDLTTRGRERLQWYDEQEKRAKGQSPWL